MCWSASHAVRRTGIATLLEWLDELEGAEAIRRDVAAALESAADNLVKCLALGRAAGGEGIVPRFDGAPEEILRMQFLVNVTALFALAGLTGHSLGKEGDRLAGEVLENQERLKASFEARKDRLFLAELYAFMLSRNGDRNRIGDQLQKVREGEDVFTLEIDKRLFGRLMAMFSREGL